MARKAVVPKVPTDIISLDRLRHETRQPSSFKGHDDLLQELLADAVAYVGKEISRPLLEVMDKAFVTHPCDNNLPASIFKTDIISIYKFEYWSQDVLLRNDPDQTILVSNLGRLEERAHHCYFLYPPEDGWPNILQNSRFQVTLKRCYGVNKDNDSLGLRRAIIAHVREAYDGNLNNKTLMAIKNLISNCRVRTGG